MNEYKLEIETTNFNLHTTHFPQTLGTDQKGQRVSIVDVINRSSTEEYHQSVLKLRSIEDEKLRKRSKYEFPCITPHVVVAGGAEKDNIIEETNMLLCDWDFALGEVAREKFPTIAKVLGKYMLFNRFSISGTGVHTLLLIEDPKKRIDYIEAIDAYFKELGFQQDPMFRNPVQKVIITSGDGQMLNSKPVPFTGSFDDVAPVTVTTKSVRQRNSRASRKKDKENPIKITTEFLKNKYRIVRDTLTGNVTVNGKVLDEQILSTLIMDALLEGHVANKELISIFIKSGYVIVENRFQNFTKKYEHLYPSDMIKRLSQSLIVESIPPGYPNFVEDGLRLWLVKLVAQLEEPTANEIALFLVGGQGIGKSYFFSHVLPPELSDLYAEISFSSSREFKLATTRYIIIADDELKSRITEIDFVKSILSNPYVNVRKLYDVLDFNYRKIASFAGTSNDPQLLNDPSGNRRFLILMLKGVDREMYASVDKVALLMEAYRLYKSGFELEPSKEFLKALEINSKQFEVLNVAEELLINHFPAADPENDPADIWFWWPCNHLVAKLNSLSNVKVKEYHVGVALKKMKYPAKYMQINNSKLRVYAIKPAYPHEWGGDLPPIDSSSWQG